MLLLTTSKKKQRDEGNEIKQETFYKVCQNKIRRGPKLEGYAFVNFGNSSGTQEEPSQKREK